MIDNYNNKGKNMVVVDNYNNKRKTVVDNYNNKGKVAVYNCFPEDLAESILLRLPVKSLLRFKSVSKSWFSLISHPNFAKSHFEQATEPTRRLLHISQSRYEAQSIDIDRGGSAPINLALPIPRSLFSDCSVHILGSCRGFILLDDPLQNLILWNPSTGVHKTLSYPPIAYKDKHTCNFSVLYGFGYDKATDDYIVVAASSENSGFLSNLELFSVRTNSWKEIEGVCFPYIRFDRFFWRGSGKQFYGLFFNGNLHWLPSDIHERYKAIITFDLKERMFSKISLPEDIGGGSNLRIVEGCLSVFYRHIKFDWVANILVMKEYKVQTSWTKCFVPINGGPLVSLDDSEEPMELKGKGALPEHHIYTESILSLPSDKAME